jgi:hypothetical protein
MKVSNHAKWGRKLNWEIEYYQKANGDIPVEDFLLSLNPKLRAKAYSDIMLLKQLGINIRAPYSAWLLAHIKSYHMR